MQPLPEENKFPQIWGRITNARQKRDKRIGTGCDPLIAGWQCFLEELLIRMETFLIPGNLVTFQSLEKHEQREFERLYGSIILPPHVSAVYIPPSVLKGLIPADYGRGADSRPAHIPNSRLNCGLVLACQHHEYRLIINALLASPPNEPGIDVYTEGELRADYGYATVGECQEYMQPVIWTHLHTHVDLPSLI